MSLVDGGDGTARDAIPDGGGGTDRHVQIVKIMVGDLGVSSGLVGPSASLPVSLSASVAIDVSDRSGRALGIVTANQGAAAAHVNRWAMGLSDGAAFIAPALDASVLAVRDRLPAALAGGRLDINLGASTVAIDVSDRALRALGIVDVSDRAGRLLGIVTQGTAAAVGSPWPFRLSDGAAFYDGTKTGQLPAALVGGRVDANIGAWLGSVAPTIGAKTSANSLPVVIASDQAAIPVTTVIPGTAATNLGKAEDAVAGDGDVGVFSLGVRNDVPTTAKTSADGDYVQSSRDRAGVAWVRPLNMLPTYGASYRLAAATAGQVSLTFTFTANTDKQLATIYHLGSSTKTVRIRKIAIVVSTGAAGVFGFELRQLSATTTPAGGNPAIVPGKFNGSDAAAEAACLALPTTAGSVVANDSPVSPHFEWNAAAAAAMANPGGVDGQELVLFDARAMPDGMSPLVMRAAVAEGWGVVGRCTAAVALRFTVYVLFTEE